MIVSFKINAISKDREISHVLGIILFESERNVA